ncbi:DUF2713 family protein [Shigella flexneri]
MTLLVVLPKLKETIKILTDTSNLIYDLFWVKSAKNNM